MKRTKLPTRSRFAACVVIVCLVTLQCEWTVVAQTSGTSADAAGAGSGAGRRTVLSLHPSPWSGVLDSSAPLFAGRPGAATPGPGGVRGPLEAAVDTAVADGVVRATLLASRAQVQDPKRNPKKNKTLMWILIGAGAGGAALAFALLKPPPEEMATIDVGTPEVGAPQ